MAPLRTVPTLAVGPVMPGWGSWDWIGTFVLKHLNDSFRTSAFKPWRVPVADVVVIVKHAPPRDWIEAASRRSVIVYCPIDAYGDAAEIATDAAWLRQCAHVIVHCRRLIPYFSSLAKTSYIDHPIKFATPIRTKYRADGPLLWIGVRTNLPPLINWVDAHPLPAALDVLTNPEREGEVPTSVELGFRPDRAVRVHAWSPQRHLDFTLAARAALDIKGDNFRSRHKPPAKALDFIASGLPIALNASSSPQEHLAELGLEVPSPLEIDVWLSKAYWKKTVEFGKRLARELAPERVADRFLDIVNEALASRNSSSMAAASVISKTDRRADELATLAPAARPLLPVFGLLITKDDEVVFADWCRNQLGFYERVVCLDGSEGDQTARIAARFGERLVYLHERQFKISHKTDHGLRDVVHREIVRRFGSGHWIMCCHPDEFCYHDPRKIAAHAEAGGFDQVSWFSPHFYPHPDEWRDWPGLKHLSVPERHRHYHWDYQGTRLPWLEDRLYKAAPGVEWDGKTHGNVRPLGLRRSAPFHPILRHFKVLVTDPEFYDVSPSAAHYRTHWVGTPGRTGVPFPVREPKDLFVRSAKNYERCDRFDGAFSHAWNMGEQFRPDPSCDAIEDRLRQYRVTQELIGRGENEKARATLLALDTNETELRLRALVKNDLATLDAIGGNQQAAMDGYAAALDLDTECRVARANVAILKAEIPERAEKTLPPVMEDCSVRVAVISLLFNWPSTGGGNVHTAELTKFLSEAGYEVRHFYAKYDAWGIGRVSDPTPHAAEPICFSEAGWTAGGIVDKFRHAVDLFDPDWVILTDSWNMKPVLVDAVGSHPYILRLQALECLCPLNNVRLLPGPSGEPMQCHRHQLATPDACAQCVRERGRTSGSLHQAERALAGVGTPQYRETLFRAFANAAAVLAVNPLTAAMVEPFAKNVQVVTAGMDPARFPWPFPSAGLTPRTAGRTRIVFAGLTNEWMKGFHVLQTACERLWSKRQDFELVATDDAPSAVPEPWLRYIGWQSQDDLPRVLAGSDIVVVPTVAQEALGRTAVEAMAAGKPVVASRLGGLTFTVADGATGLLCEAGNPDDLAAKLSLLLDDSALRERLGNAGRERFEAHYAWPVIIDKHYRPLLGDPTRGKPRRRAGHRAVTQSHQGSVLVVVSHYADRPVEPLVRLLDAMKAYDAGTPYTVRLVVNWDGKNKLNLPARHRAVEIIYRANPGYDIGAWEFGWRTAPSYDAYLFLQSECRIVHADWVAAFLRVARTPRVGLVGECLSPDWDAPWKVLAERFRGRALKEHTLDGRPAERVDCYLDFFRKNGIPPSLKGDHLQTLVVFATREVLERVNGFPEGRGYGEAIAAEIGLSKKIQAAGLTLAQVEPDAFSYIEHPQWLHRQTRTRVNPSTGGTRPPQ